MAADGPAPCTCCSRVARTASPAARRRSASLLGDAATESADDPAGGATYPWDTAATGDDRATASSSPSSLSGLADVLATATRAGCTLRGSAGAGVAYAAARTGHARRRGCGRRASGSARPAPASAAASSWWTRPPRSRPRSTSGDRCPPRPDAPRQGPVRSGPPARAGTIRGRHLDDRPASTTTRYSGRPGSIIDLGLPVARWRVRRAPPAGRCADRRLRALRVLPADLPDLRPVGRGDGLAARAHLPDEGGPRGRADVATRWCPTGTPASAAWRA